MAVESWEYKNLYLDYGNSNRPIDMEKVVSKLNEEGKFGWELVAIDSCSSKFYFKRRA